MSEINMLTRVALVAKNPPAKAGDSGDADSIPGLGRSCGADDNQQENSKGRGDWWATVHGVAKTWT